MANLDIIGAIELTLVAALLIASAVAGYGLRPEQRIRAALALGGWFGAVVILAGAGAFAHPTAGGPLFGLAVLAPVVIGVRLGGTARVREAIASYPLPWLIGLHAMRVIGADFVMLQGQGRLPAPFAPAAGWGDVFIGVTALPLAWLVHRRAAGWRTLAVIWSGLGMLDLIVAIVLGVTSNENAPLRLFGTGVGTAIMTQLPWSLVPTFGVPMLFLAHLAALRRLRMPARVPAPA